MSLRRARRAALAFTLAVSLLPITAATALANEHPVFFSEIHYDNAGTDVGEAIEITGPAGTDVTGWSIVLYNGSNGAVYNTRVLSGVIPTEGAFTEEYPSNGIQNGSPDAFALVDDLGTLVEFLSYEGTLLGVGGAADGVTSTDIGVEEPSDTAIGDSLQLIGGTWTAPAPNTFAPPLVTEPDDPPVVPDVHFSEIHYDNAGTDVGEAIEITGPAGTDVTGWSIVLYNGSNGAVYNTRALSGVIPTEGAFTEEYPSNGIQNGSPDGFALVDDLGSVVEFLSYEGAFAAVGGPADGLTSTDIGVAESSGTPVGDSLQRIDGVWTGPAFNTFVGLTPLEQRIHDVQGSGLASPLAGRFVAVEGIVVSNEPGLQGFFLQEEDGHADTDPATSEGIFVFNPGAVPITVDDRIRVTGFVAEFFGLTELTGIAVEAPTQFDADPVASAATVSLPVASLGDFEAYEGMLVTFPQSLVISEYFNFDRFGEVVLALPAPGEDRPFTPTAVSPTGSLEAQARADLNLRSRITVDDGRSPQNPDPAIHPGNGEVFDLDNLFRGGETVTGMTGAMHFGFNLYRVLPTDHGEDDDTVNPRQSSPDDVGGDLTVGALNVLNFFTTLDDSGSICGANQNLECRGADNAGEFERQRAKILAALEGMDADVVGLIEMENTPGVEPMERIVDGLDGYAYIDTGVIGTDAIKVGIIYRSEVVTPVGDFAILDSSVDPRFLDEKSRPVLAQSFAENASGEVFTVAVNHLKSKGSSCDDVGDPGGTLAGNCNEVRTQAAAALADWLAADPTDSGDSDFLIIGDLNSYDKETPITTLTDAGYTDLLLTHEGEFAYTFVFDGQYGYLDYALSSASLTSQVTGATVWHINADEADLIDYDTSFKKDAQDAIFAPDAFRSSDHDPVIVGLDLDAAAAVTSSVDPDSLWPPNHKYVEVTVSASEGSFEIVEVTSSEADSGLGVDDLPDDIVITGASTIDLRAERFSTDGRTYTITVYIRTDFDQAKVDHSTVLVPRDQRRGPQPH
jgi:predicted extracellular nuclease